MGGGYVNTTMAPEIARRVIEQDLGIPAQNDRAMIYPPVWQSAREEYWATYDRGALGDARGIQKIAIVAQFSFPETLPKAREKAHRRDVRGPRPLKPPGGREKL